MNYRFHPEALREFEEAARYYADCQEGLELRFIVGLRVHHRRYARPPRTKLLAESY